MAHAPHLLAASHLVLIKDNQVLLQRRFQTGWMDGFYSVPAGHVEDSESGIQALVREVNEEIGIVLDPQQLTPAHVMHRYADATHQYIDLFYTCRTWKNDPRICEPEKCDDLSWFPIDTLPENTVPYIKEALSHIKMRNFYSELGWKE